jgi:hypothetical protein
VPYERIGQWADALGLAGKQVDEFHELAWLALSPEEVRELVAELRRELIAKMDRGLRRR